MEKINDWNRPIDTRKEYETSDVELLHKEDAGKFILRLAIGGLMLFHGFNKLIYGNQEVNEILTNVGIPAFFGFGVFLGEVIGPVLVLIGYKVRIGAALMAMNMIIAILLVHSSQLDEVNPMGGWMIELNALYLLGAIAVFFLGSGRFAISKGNGALD